MNLFHGFRSSCWWSCHIYLLSVCKWTCFMAESLLLMALWYLPFSDCQYIYGCYTICWWFRPHFLLRGYVIEHLHVLYYWYSKFYLLFRMYILGFSICWRHLWLYFQFYYLQWVCICTYIMRCSKAHWIAAFDSFQQVKYFILIACTF